MNRPRFLLALLLSGLLVIGNPAIFSPFADAWAKGFSSSRSSSFSRGSSSSRGAQWSSSTRSTWNRNGGGILGGEKRSLGGYSKPELQGTSPSTRTGVRGESRPSSSGYTKPEMQGSTPSRQINTGESRTSGGYSKPTTGTKKAQTFTGGSKFDKQAISQEQKKRSQDSLKQYQAEQAKFKNPEQKIDPKQYASNPLYQKGKVYSGFDYRDYYGNRDRYYGSQGYRPPAVRVQYCAELRLVRYHFPVLDARSHVQQECSGNRIQSLQRSGLPEVATGSGSHVQRQRGSQGQAG